jgi:hypothetical protein
MADTDFWKQDKPATEVNTIRAGVAGPMGASDEEIDREMASTRDQLAQTTDPANRAMLEEYLAHSALNRSRPQPGGQPSSNAWWAQDRPAGQGTLPAGTQPSSAGAGRGVVNPPLATNPAPEPAPASSPFGDPLGTVAPEILAAASPPASSDAGGGRGFVNPPQVGEAAPQRDVGFWESAGRGWGKAGATSLKVVDLASAAPVVVAENLKNMITGGDSTSAQDAFFRNFVDPTQHAIDWYALKPDEKQGFLGKVGEALGGMAQDLPLMIASGGAAAPETAALHNPTIARFIENATSRGFDAMRLIMVKAGTEKAQQVLDAGGTPEQAIKSATTAALITGFQGVMPMSAQGPWWQRFLTGIPVGPVQSEAGRVVQNAGDPEALHRDFDPADAAASAVTNAVASTAMGHAAQGRTPDRIALGYDPITGKKPVAAAVDEAFPAEPGAKPVQPGQAQPATAPAVKPDVASQLDAIRPLRDRVQRLRAAGEKTIADELERRANTQAAEVELQGMPDASPAFQDYYRSLRVAGTAPAEAGTRAGMLDAFEQSAQDAGFPEGAVQPAIDKANALPLDKVPGFLDSYAQALGKRGLGDAPQPGELTRTIGAAGEQAMQRSLDTVYPQRLTPEHQQASDMLAAIDAGGIPLNPAKLRKIAEGWASRSTPTRARKRPSRGSARQSTVSHRAARSTPAVTCTSPPSTSRCIRQPRAP